MSALKGAGRKGSVLKRLKAEEAQDVLRRLLAAHSDLSAEAEQIARSLLGDLTFETIAEEVEEAACALGLDDLNGRAGPQGGGYVEPTEAAWEILEEAVEPFIADIKRRIELGLEAEALEICKGVVLGVYRVDHGQWAELAEYAPDFPGEAAGDAIETWLSVGRTKNVAGRGSRRSRAAFPQESVERFVPEWREMIARIVSGRR